MQQLAHAADAQAEAEAAEQANDAAAAETPAQEVNDEQTH